MNDLLHVVAFHVGEIDALYALLADLRRQAPSFRTTIAVTRPDIWAQVGASPGYRAAAAALGATLVHCPANAANARTAPLIALPGAAGRLIERAARKAGRLVVALAAMPRLAAMVARHRIASVEGTQYATVPSLVCLAARLFRRPCFLHGHAVAPVETLPTEAPTILWARGAWGIAYSGSALARELYAPQHVARTCLTGLIKYAPAWRAFCDEQFAGGDDRPLLVLGKRIAFPPYQRLLGEVLDALARRPGMPRILIKPHPSDDDALYRQIAAAHGRGLRTEVTREPNFALLPQALGAICFPGSSIVDCDVQGTPGIELRPTEGGFRPRKVPTTAYANSGYASTQSVELAVDHVLAGGSARAGGAPAIPEDDPSCAADLADLFARLVHAGPPGGH